MVTLKWVEAQIEQSLGGANAAKNIYDLAVLYIVRDHLRAAEQAEAPKQEQTGYSRSPAPVEAEPVDGQQDAPMLRAADPYYGQAPYTHGAGVLSKADARLWVESLINADGTRGGRWSMQDVRSLAEKRGYTTEAELVEFWAVMCMMAADYGEVAKHYGVSSAEFYADMARAWINDPDAVEDKAGKYLEWIVQ